MTQSQTELTGSTIPIAVYPVYRDGLMWKGKYVDNGYLSNLTHLSAPIMWRGRLFDNVEAAYVAEKNPDALVSFLGEDIPFIDYVVKWCKENKAYGVKKLGVPKSRGGLIDAVPEWDTIRISVMLSLLALKFAPDTREALWLMAQKPEYLVEYNNWGDRFWGAVLNKDQTEARGRNILGFLLCMIRSRLLQGNPITSIPHHLWRRSQDYTVWRIIESRKISPYA